jgi:hypothetical protein
MPVPLTVSSSFDPGMIGTNALEFIGGTLIPLLGIVSTLALAIGMMAMLRHYAKKITQSGAPSRDAVLKRRERTRRRLELQDRQAGLRRNVGRSHTSHRKASRGPNFFR